MNTKTQPVASEPSSVERAELIAELEEAAKFCDGVDMREFASRFRRAASLLSSDAKPASEQHPDDKAVDFFAQVMRAKMKKQREKGYGGWESCPTERLQKMLIDHIAKGDPVDVANFAMMLYCRGDSTAAPASEQRNVTKEEDEVLRRAAMGASTVVHPGRLASEPVAVPQGWRLVPVVPTPEMIAAAALNVLPDPSAADFEIARKGARLILSDPRCPPSATLEALAAAMATIIPAHRAMLSAAPSPEPVGINGLTEETKITAWWDSVKNDLLWSGAIQGLSWNELWDEAKDGLGIIFRNRGNDEPGAR